MTMRGRSDWTGGVVYPGVDGITNPASRLRKYEDGSWGAAQDSGVFDRSAAKAPSPIVLSTSGGSDPGGASIINCESPRVPLLWSVVCIVRFGGIGWVTEANAFTLTLRLNVGIGRAQEQIDFPLVLPAGPYLANVVQRVADIPARRLSAGALLSGTATITSTYSARFFLAAAPTTLIGDDT